MSNRVVRRRTPITPHGTAGSYSQKTTAEHIALRVYGVKGVANDLVVQLPSALARTDTEIAHAVLNALKWNTLVPEERLSVVIENGWVRLTGTVDWQCQKDVSGRAVCDLLGVKGDTNEIVVKPHVKTSDVREKIEAAFRRSAEIDARRISVAAHDGTVILSGTFTRGPSASRRSARRGRRLGSRRSRIGSRSSRRRTSGGGSDDCQGHHAG